MEQKIKLTQKKKIVVITLCLITGMGLVLHFLLSNFTPAGVAEGQSTASQLQRETGDSTGGSATKSGFLSSLFKFNTPEPRKTSKPVTRGTKTALATHSGTPSSRDTNTPESGASPTSGVQGYFDGEVFYFATDEGNPAASTATWYVIYHTPRPSATLAPTFAPTRTFTPKPTSTSKFTKTPTRTLTVTATPSLTPSPTVTATLTLTFTLTPSITPTQTPTPTFTPTATPTNTQQATDEPPDPTDEAPQSGSFVYLSKPVDGGMDLVNWITLPDITPTLITELADVELCNWSPDGSQLLIQVKRGETEKSDLQTLALDGVLTPLTASLPGSSQCGDYLPDGSAIVFPYTDESGASNISKIILVEGEIQEIFRDGNQYERPDVSPDGRRVVFLSSNETVQDLKILDLKDLSVQTLTNSIETEASPRFLPDSQTVVFSRVVEQTWDVFAIDIDTLEETLLTDDPGNELWTDARWDGKYILFSSNASGTFNIYWLLNGSPTIHPLLSSDASQLYPLWRP